MKRILLISAAICAFAAPVMAQQAVQQQQQGQTAKPSGDLFLRSGDGTAVAPGQGYVRSGPINLKPGATAGSQIQNEAAQRAAAQVYNPAQKIDPAAAAAAAANAPDYSASTYNQTRNVKPVTTQKSAGTSLIKDPFPSWFGGYTPPTLAELRSVKAARAAQYARKDAAEAQARQQQQQPKRTTAFGTTSEQKRQQAQ